MADRFDEFLDAGDAPASDKFDAFLDAPDVAAGQPVARSRFDDFLDAPDGESYFRRAGDIGISVLKSAISVPEIAVGLADLPTAGYAGKMAESAGFRPREAKEFLDEYLSPSQKAANKAVSDAKGFVPTLEAAVRNPSTIGHAVLESTAPMLAGGVLAKAIPLAPWAAGAVGEGIVGTGLAAEQIRQQTDDGLLTPKQIGAAVASGAFTASIGAAGARIANKLGISDVDTMLAGGASQATQKGVTRRIVEGGITEGVFEEMPQSAQEQVWQNAAMDRPLLEGMSEAAAMGLLTGASMGAGVNVLPLGRTTGQSPQSPAAPAAGTQAATPPVATPAQPDAGFEPMADTILDDADILAAQSVDEAIAAAQANIGEASIRVSTQPPAAPPGTVVGQSAAQLALPPPKLIGTPEGDVGTEAQVEAASAERGRRGVELGTNEVAGAVQGRAPLPDVGQLDLVPAEKEPPDLLKTLARSGGISREAAQADGVDPANFGEQKYRTMVFGRPLFPKAGGMGMDEIAEFLSQSGYLPEGNYSANDALDLIGRALSGEKIYSQQDAGVAAERAARQREDDQRQQFAGEPGDAGVEYRAGDLRSRMAEAGRSRVKAVLGAEASQDWQPKPDDFSLAGYGKESPDVQDLSEVMFDGRRVMGGDAFDTYFERFAEQNAHLSGDAFEHTLSQAIKEAERAKTEQRPSPARQDQPRAERQPEAVQSGDKTPQARQATPEASPASQEVTPPLPAAAAAPASRAVAAAQPAPAAAAKAAPASAEKVTRGTTPNAIDEVSPQSAESRSAPSGTSLPAAEPVKPEPSPQTDMFAGQVTEAVKASADSTKAVADAVAGLKDEVAGLRQEIADGGAQRQSEDLLGDSRLAGITVRVKAVEAETGRKISYNEKADVALRDVNDRISLAQRLAECLRS